VNSRIRMNLPVDVSKLAAFDDKHQTPHDTVKTMRSNLEVMHKIIRTNILENQTDMKTAFDAKVRLYGYVKGGIVLLNDPVEKVGVSGKLRRRWIGPFEIVWLSSHNCKLVNPVTGREIRNLVHINRIKPYFYKND